MLYRTISHTIEEHLRSGSEKIMLVDGARQIGKSFIVREVGRRVFKNFIELNMVEDFLQEKMFENVRTVADFYLAVSTIAGSKLEDKENTLIFIDEIQQYPELLTLLKFLVQDGKYTYIASGSLLGVTLSQTTSIPMGSIERVRMFPLSFEEFLLANDYNREAIDGLRSISHRKITITESMHARLLDLFRKYLIVGGLPDAVNAFLFDKNIEKVRKVQRETYEYYKIDASKYDEANKLKIRRIYDGLPSVLQNKKKRVRFQDIENKRGKTFADYEDEFDYLTNSGIALEVQAISNPNFPLIETAGKNLLKLYLNDVGVLTSILYGNNIQAIMEDRRSVNLGAGYETAVASELAAHGHKLFYYDNRNKGEVDFLIDNYDDLAVVPIEVKSGRDYSVHSAINTFVNNEDYHCRRAYVLSNKREVKEKNGIIHMPVYYAMFL